MSIFKHDLHNNDPCAAILIIPQECKSDCADIKYTDRDIKYTDTTDLYKHNWCALPGVPLKPSLNDATSQ